MKQTETLQLFACKIKKTHKKTSKNKQTKRKEMKYVYWYGKIGYNKVKEDGKCGFCRYLCLL